MEKHQRGEAVEGASTMDGARVTLRTDAELERPWSRKTRSWCLSCGVLATEYLCIQASSLYLFAVESIFK